MHLLCDSRPFDRFSVYLLLQCPVSNTRVIHENGGYQSCGLLNTSLFFPHLYHVRGYHVVDVFLFFPPQVSIVIYVLLSIGYGVYVMRLACLYNSDGGLIPGLPVVMKRVMALSSLLCVCFCLRAVIMLLQEKRMWFLGKLWFICLYYVCGELIPLILIIVLFIRNQMTAQLVKQRRLSLFSF